MGEYQPFTADPRAQPNPDPRLKPTPDFGTLGPGSDATGFGGAAKSPSAPRRPLGVVQLIAVGIGIATALLVGQMGRARPARQYSGMSPSNSPSEPLTA